MMPAMELQRRGLLLGLLAAPFVIRTPGLLMPVSARLRPVMRIDGEMLSKIRERFGQTFGADTELTDRLALDYAFFVGPFWNPLAFLE
jgi:hypothetical protein